MLRNFANQPDHRYIFDALDQFDFEFSKESNSFALLSFHTITPDSFAWKLIIDSTVYYLYAEDFLTGLGGVKFGIATASGQDDIKLEFIPAKEPVAFEDSSPNKVAEVYKPPIDEYNFMKYSAPSGYDHVFLCRTDIRIEDAYFIE